MKGKLLQNTPMNTDFVGNLMFPSLIIRHLIATCLNLANLSACYIIVSFLLCILVGALDPTTQLSVLRPHFQNLLYL